MLNTNNGKSYFLTDLNGEKINFSERLIGKININQRFQILGNLLNDFPKIPINTSLQEDFKIMKEVIGELSNTDFLNIDYETIQGDFTELTKTYNVSKYLKLSKLDKAYSANWNDSAITKAIFLIYLRAQRLIEKLYSEMMDRASKYKLFGDTIAKFKDAARTSQPATATTTSATITAIKKGQRVSGKLTDTNDGKNITKLIRAAIEKFQLYGTKSDLIEKVVPSLKDGFDEKSLIIHIKAGLRKKIKEYDVADDGEKFAMQSDAKGKKLDKRVSSIDGVELKESFWLPDDVLFVVFTKRCAMFAFPTFEGALEISMAKGGGGKSVVKKLADGSYKSENTHSSEIFIDFTSFYRTVIAYHGEAIFVKGVN